MSTLRRGMRRWATAAALLMLAGPATAQALLPVPPLTGHVIDQTGTLSAEQLAALEQTLVAFDARKGTQLAVLMVARTAPEAIEPYALRVAEVWKLGRKKVDDGVLLVVAKDERAVRIEVGYGLEGVLTDAGSGRIIRETLLPRFKQQDFAGGLTAGVAQIIGLIDGEALPAPAEAVTRGEGGVLSWAPLLLVLALAVGGAARAVLGKVPGAVVTGGVVAGAAWLLAGALSIALVAGVAALLVTLVGGGLVGRGLLGAALGGRSNGTGGGGFGGGGWGGGGGGGFGGGGASGRW